MFLKKPKVRGSLPGVLFPALTHDHVRVLARDTQSGRSAFRGEATRSGMQARGCTQVTRAFG